MTDVLWPPDIVPANQEWRIIGNVGAFQSPLNGATRTVGRPGARWGCRVTLPPLNGTNRARMMAVLGALRDRSARIWMPDFSVTRRGSISAPELLTNSAFSGTSGWQTSTNWALSANDGVMRVTRLTGGVEIDLVSSTPPTVTQYAPYAGRLMFDAGQSISSMIGGLYMVSSAVNASDASSPATAGMKSAAIVADSTTAALYFYDSSSSTAIAGSYADVSFMSMAQCALVDNGLNALTYSDQIDNAAWTKSACSTTANNHTAPDGTTTAEKLTEDTSTGTHYFSRSASRTSAAADLCTYGFFSSSALDRDVRLVAGNDTSNYSAATFDISAGTVGAVSNAGTATNGRAFIVSKGGGWYFCCVISRAVAATTMLAEYDMVSGGTTSYTGTTGALAVWRCGSAVSSVPTRGAQTTSAATTGTAQTGTSIYVKGLPASTNGLLKAGDPFSIGGQRNVATANLDSDAAGLGVLQCAIPVRSPADNSPIFINTPMSKMMLATDEIGWDTMPGQFSPFSIDLIEDIT